MKCARPLSPTSSSTPCTRYPGRLTGTFLYSRPACTEIPAPGYVAVYGEHRLSLALKRRPQILRKAITGNVYHPINPNDVRVPSFIKAAGRVFIRANATAYQNIARLGTGREYPVILANLVSELPQLVCYIPDYTFIRALPTFCLNLANHIFQFGQSAASKVLPTASHIAYRCEPFLPKQWCVFFRFLLLLGRIAHTLTGSAISNTPR